MTGDRVDGAGHRLPPGRRWVGYALIAVGGLLAVELTLRIVSSRLTWTGARVILEDGQEAVADSSDWPSVYPKSSRGAQRYIEFDVPVSFNADGFRDAEFDARRGPVVLLLGDSTTAGHGVREEEMFASRIEARLRESFGDAWRVWNLGRGATGTVQQVRLAERVLRDHPAADVRALLLVSAVSVQDGHGNDLTDLGPNLPYLVDGRPEPAPHAEGWIHYARRSALLHGIEAMLARWRREHLRQPPIDNLDELWGGYCRCVDRLRDLGAARGARVVLAYLSVPPSESIEHIGDLTQLFVAYAERHDVPFVRCVPKLSPIAGERFFYPIDGHPNALAHRYVADVITPVLIRTLRESEPSPD